MGASLCPLNPQLKGGLQRVGGRLQNAPGAYERKHSIILPNKLRVTDLIIRQYHKTMGHMGQERVFSLFRETYWIIKHRSAV